MNRYAPLLLTVLGTGCLFGGGGPKPPPPVETAETIRARADSLWREAEHQFRTGSWNRSASLLERALLLMDYADPRRARGSFMLGEARLAQGQNLQAVREFRRVADETASDSLAPAALVRAGDAYADLWGRPELDPSYGESALNTYREVVERYPGAPSARLAQARMLDLQEWFARKEYRTALFYYRYKAYDSSILVLRNLIASYPRTAVIPDALARLVDAYAVLGYQEDLRETCTYIGRFFPQVVPDVARRCPAAAADTG